jgi:hypothetical protein
LGNRLPDSRGSIVGFYHLFDGNNGLLDPIVKEQHEMLAASGLLNKTESITYTVIGATSSSYEFPSTLDRRYVKSKLSRASAWEDLTLQALYEHCVAQPDDRVFYIHSKGSFHPKPTNTRFRHLLMQGVTEPCCLDMLSTHDVCGWRFMHVPHFHVPGNMWLARCDYVRKLTSPSKFAREPDRKIARGCPDWR